MRVATWNINSIRLRLPLVLRFLDEEAPDVLCLQETKAPNGAFPTDALDERGYPHRVLMGMKGYNGVAILSRLPLREVTSRRWCDRNDCRHVAATLPGGIELHNFYVPAGGDIPDPGANEKFRHKLQFVDEVTGWLTTERSRSAPMMIVGDLNIAPLETDVWSHKQLLDVVSHTPVETEKLTRMQEGIGFTDTTRHIHGVEPKLYSWWSYRARDWELSDRGRRLDHIWVTEPLTPAITAARILRPCRGWPPKPSDHVPVVTDLDL